MPASAAYYLPGGGTSANLTVANWTTMMLGAPWTPVDQRTMTDTAAYDETVVVTPATTMTTTVVDSPAYDETVVITPATTRTTTVVDAPASDVVVQECTPRTLDDPTAQSHPHPAHQASLSCGAATSKVTLGLRARSTVWMRAGATV